jgi:hypothetical protein
VRETVEDWLRDGLDGTSERTRALYQGLLEPVVEMIGARPLRDLSAGDVRSALGKLVTRYSTRSLQITRNAEFSWADERGSWLSLRSRGKWPAEPDAYVQDDGCPDETEGSGNPVVRVGPGLVHGIRVAS